MPAPLREAVASWQAAGRRPQRGSPWSLSAWQKWFPEHSTYLSALAQLTGGVTRAQVIERCAAAHTGPQEAERSFVTAMIWGYGRVGYGPFRTKRVLTENDDAGEILARVALVAREQGGPSAFAWLAGPQHRLRWLGVAFATKFLFFCAANGRAGGAPILDRLVRNWLADNAGWRLSLDWNVDDYRGYAEAVRAWGAELGVDQADVEMIIFQLGAAADRTSPWRDPGLFGEFHPPAHEETAEPDEGGAVIDALDEAADLFDALPDSTPGVVDDFDRCLRELKRIVLVRGRQPR